MRRLGLSAVLIAAVLVQPSTPLAWEAATTHAGIAEQAALASALHSRVESDLGVSGGLFARLIVPPADAPELLKLLARFNPTYGFVPDGRGRQTALAWLAAGAALADSPARFAANHFLDPNKRAGLDDHTLDSAAERALHRLRARQAGAALVTSGRPAHEWVIAKDNPLGLDGFIDQYARAAKARTPGERERHLAGALIAAGAMVHVLSDMASPSHVRVDLAAHFDKLGQSKRDVGSRLERIATLSYGRLGIGPASEVVHRDRLESFFVNSKGTGLAQLVARNFVSRYTMPAAHRLPRSATRQDVDGAVRRALGREDVVLRDSDSGLVVHDSRGTCLAHVRHRNRNLEFYLEDSCVLSQLQTLLPLAVSYAAGLVDYLFRGQLTVAVGDSITVQSTLPLGDGELTLLWDDGAGVRTSFHTSKVSSRIQLGGLRAPSGSTRIVAVFEGRDKLGEPLVAVGSAATVAP